MKQQPLFPATEPTFLDYQPEHKEVLEKIASSPCVISGNDRRPEKADEYFNRQLQGSNVGNFTIHYNGEIVGFASMWDGWQPWEMEQGEAKIELAFVSDSFPKDKIPLLEKRLYDKRSEFEKETREW